MCLEYWGMVQLVSTSDFDSGDIGSNPVTPAHLYR